MLKKIGVESLTLGMHIHKLCGSWINHPFWRTKFVISDPQDLRRIHESGITELWIDVTKGADIVLNVAEGKSRVHDKQVSMETSLHQGALQGRAPEKEAMAEELRRAVRICADSKKAMTSMFQELRMGKAISSQAAGDLVGEISSSVTRNPYALISLARLKNVDDYTYLHSVAVSALMVALARQLNQDEKLAYESGMAGLLHDVGKAFIPKKILNKPGKLTEEEAAIMKRHAIEGHKALLNSGSVGDIALDVALHHHEKIDGSGYPEFHPADKISQYSKMCAVCDVYDAITSNRSYKSGWDPAESIRTMTSLCNGHFDVRIFHAFVKTVGIYPIGSLVRLESERLAVVVEQAEKSLIAPTVKAFFSTKTGTRINPELLALSHSSTHEKIVGLEDPAKWGIRNLEQMWAV